MTAPVSFELAKLLKEKGFDKPCREGWVNYLASFTGETRMPDDESNLVLDRLGNTHLIERPTIADVCMWLYEEHGIWVSVVDNNPEQTKWEYQISRKGAGLVYSSAQYPSTYYNSPTEAYEKAIEYTLKHLIP